MTDLVKQAAQVCADIIDFADDFPDSAAAFPVAVITDIGNASAAVLDGVERSSTVELQIDIFDNGATPETVLAKAVAVSDMLISYGWTRYFGSRTRDGGDLQRYSMRFRCEYDNYNDAVYKA